MSRSTRTGAWNPLAWLLVLLLLLVIHAWWYWPFLSDDALISLRYVQRLLHGQGLTWTDGPRVEGYSNLLWMLVIAAPGALGMDLVMAARVLGVLGMAATVAIPLVFYARRLSAGREAGPLVVGTLFFVLAAPTAVWAIGGLEQPLVAALLAATTVLAFSILDAGPPARGRLLALSLVLGLLCVTRPDGPLFTVATMAVLVPWSARATSGATRDARAPMSPVLVGATIALFPVLLYGAQLAFRRGYYHDWLPNPARVKIGPSLHRSAEGAVYLAKTFVSLFPFSFVAVGAWLAMAARPPLRAKALLLGVTATLWCAYLMVVGGDTFPSGRQFFPVVVVMMFALIEGLPPLLDAIARSWSRTWSRRWRLAFATVAFAAFVACQVRFNHRAREERWEWDGQALALTLERAFHDRQPLMAVTAAGCLPYWTGFPAVDMLGLNDFYLPRHRPPDMGQGPMGHELGSGRYVLDRKPDLIVFHTGLLAGDYRGDRELLASDEFHREYVPVTVRCESPRRFDAIVWMRIDSDRIRVRREGGTWVVPGR